MRSTHRLKTVSLTVNFRKIISRLEVSLGRIEFLEKKIKDQQEEYREDSQKLMNIISKSRETFKQVIESKQDADSTVATEMLDTTFGTISEMN